MSPIKEVFQQSIKHNQNLYTDKSPSQNQSKDKEVMFLRRENAALREEKQKLQQTNVNLQR